MLREVKKRHQLSDTRLNSTMRVTLRALHAFDKLMYDLNAKWCYISSGQVGNRCYLHFRLVCGWMGGQVVGGLVCQSDHNGIQTGPCQGSTFMFSPLQHQVIQGAVTTDLPPPDTSHGSKIVSLSLSLHSLSSGCIVLCLLITLSYKNTNHIDLGP